MTTVTQYTDPLCTWCWGAEPIVRRLEEVYRGQIEMDFVMGGLVETFDDFYDAANDIGSPEDVKDHWVEARQKHGMPMDTKIFDQNPADSTYPACIAYEAAEFQSKEKAHEYLRRMREAYMTECTSTEERENLVELAGEVGLDTDAFTDALDDGSAEEAFEEDLREMRQAGARGFPSFHIEGPQGEVMARGFQRFQQLSKLVERADPSITAKDPRPIPEFVEAHEYVATQEVAEVYQMTKADARERLLELDEEGEIQAVELNSGYFWQPPGGVEGATCDRSGGC